MKCLLCRRIIKNPESMKIGVGPKCAAKLKLLDVKPRRLGAIRDNFLDDATMDLFTTVPA